LGREALNRGTSALEAALVARQLSAFEKVKNSQKILKILSKIGQKP
jgi:hypothetical protein